MLCLEASLAAGSTEPLRMAFGHAWRPALPFWLVPAVIAAGPLPVGLLHDVSGDWQVAGIFLGLVGLAAMLAGLAAGRNRYVADSR